jgi:hypothetical protein
MKEEKKIQGLRHFKAERTERRVIMCKSLSGSTSPPFLPPHIGVVRWFPMKGGFLCAVYKSTRLDKT